MNQLLQRRLGEDDLFVFVRDTSLSISENLRIETGKYFCTRYAWQTHDTTADSFTKRSALLDSLL